MGHVVGYGLFTQVVEDKMCATPHIRLLVLVGLLRGCQCVVSLPGLPHTSHKPGEPVDSGTVTVLDTGHNLVGRQVQA